MIRLSVFPGGVFVKQLKETMLESLHSVLPISAIVLVLSVTIAPLDSGVLVLFLFGKIGRAHV